MAGLFVQQRQSSNAAAGTQLISGSISSTAGNELACIITCTSSGVTPTVSIGGATNFGTWVEDTSLRHQGASQVCMYVFYIDAANTLSATGQMTVSYGTSVTNRGLYYVEASGIDHYFGGVFPAYQVNPGTGGDAITPGNLNITTAPAYMLGFAYDQSNAGTLPAVGASSSAWTSEGTGWTMGTSANANLLDNRAIGTGNQTVTFQSSNGGAASFGSMLLAFIESTSTQLLMAQCMY